MNDIQTMRVGDIALAHCSPVGEKKGLPILFVHGAWLGKWTFENWQRLAADRGWESYAIDLRGHHESPGDLSKTSIREYAKGVEHVVAQIGECYLVGHSMGGLVAQLVASRSNKIKKAVLVASSPPAGIVYLNAFVIKMIKYLPKMLSATTLLPKKNDVEDFFDRLDPNIYDRLVPESVRASWDVVLPRIRIKAIPYSTLVVAAQYDRLIPLSAEKKIARKYNSDFIEIADMGHMMMLEKGWERPIEEILRWLARGSA